ncbi:MAG: GNAT family N-acetyltransferase [Pseudomonadota bacterium]|nr:GNAT family N-acetyltransferase [Pseudomonadota bacterium]
MTSSPDTPLVLRRATDAEDWEALTALLHRAYGTLAAQGLRFYASHQPASATRERAESGECWVGELEGRVVCTITLIPPERCRGANGRAAWYDRPEVAKFGQMAVEPELGRRGIGSMMMDLVERRARECGARELALDTAEGATQLLAMYEARGYRFIEHVDWQPTTNYRSRLLSLTLG